MYLSKFRASTSESVKKRTINRVLQVGPLSLKFITLIIFTAVTLFYLAQKTQSATNNYDIEALDRERSKLQDEFERLHVESLRLQALKELKSATESMGLEPISQP